MTVYKFGIRAFLTYVYEVTPEQSPSMKDTEAWYESPASRYLQEERDHATDLMGFATSLTHLPQVGPQK